MDHKLRVTVRVDVDSTTVSLDVGSCLTADSCASLFPLIRRAHGMPNGSKVTVDASAAAHVEQDGLDILRRFAAGEPIDSPALQGEPFDGELIVVAPDILLECPISNDSPCDPEPVAA